MVETNPVSSADRRVAGRPSDGERPEALQSPTLQELLRKRDRHESYSQLVWRKFVKSSRPSSGR